MPHHPLTMLWELVFTWFHLALTYKRVRLRITTVPLLLFDQGQNQDRLLRLRQGPKVSLFFCLVLFCFVFYRESVDSFPAIAEYGCHGRISFFFFFFFFFFPLLFFHFFSPPSNIIFPLMLHFYLLFIERMSSRVWNFTMLYPDLMAIILDNDVSCIKLSITCE